MDGNQPTNGQQSEDSVEFLADSDEQVITIDEFPNEYVANSLSQQYPVFVIDDDPVEKELKKILPSFIENERKASTKFESERKVHSSPAKCRRKFSQENLTTLQPDVS
jgi:hypothetical protein